LSEIQNLLLVLGRELAMSSLICSIVITRLYAGYNFLFEWQSF